MFTLFVVYTSILSCCLVRNSADCLKPTARALYLTRQHDRKTVHEGEDTNIYST